MRLVATWISDEHDRGHEFEFETTLVTKTDAEPKILSAGSFVWKTANHRFVVDAGLGLSGDEEFLLFRNAVRRKGELEWKQQEYYIAIDRSDVPAVQ